MLLRRATTYLSLATGCAIAASLSLCCLPLCMGAEVGEGSGLSYLIAALFWLSLVLEQVFFWAANGQRKKIQQRAFRGRRLAHDRAGILTFCSSKEAVCIDVVLGVAVLATVLLVVLQVQNAWVVTSDLAVLLLAFSLHCIVNGKTYRYIKEIQKRKKESKRNGKTED